MRGLKQLSWVGLAVFALAACAEDGVIAVNNDDDDEMVEPGTCEPDFECGPSLEYRRGTCRPARCLEDADCCPGQICSVSVGLCADQTIACTTDADCDENPGQACIDFRGGQFCGYPNAGNRLSEAGTQGCSSSAECDPGRSCVGQRCVVFAPCDGGCPDGQVCDVDTNVCFVEPTCDLSCSAGQILVVSDPDLMSGPQCCAVECACAVLPPVELGQLGWYTDLAADDQQLVASGYDPVYGDLVVGYYSATGTRTALEYVDGFPESGPIVGDPTGPRAGRVGAGPDVGEHTSVAIDATGAIHVAYYDRDQGRLKYAVRVNGVWSVSVVDEGDNVGLYTSIAIDPDGRPRIAYMMAEGTVDPDPVARTGLKHAAASTDRPSGPSDWTVDLIESRPLPPPPCGGPCDDGSICSDLGIGNVPACYPVVDVSSCGGGCDTGEECLEIATNDFVCAEAFEEAPNDDLIPGVGLFASLAITSAGASVIAYHDRINGLVKLAIERGASFGVRVLDGEPAPGTEPPGLDVGQHTSVAVNSLDQIGVAYFDATNDDLLYYDVETSQITVVDDGVSAPDLRFVGADADLVFDVDDNPTIAYQDPTFIDLLFARRINGVWSTQVVRGADMLSTGFYAAQAHRGTTAFVGGVDVDFDADGNLELDLAVIPTSLAP